MRALRTVITAVAVAACAGSSILGASAASAADSTQTGIVNCAGKIVTKPKQITITCADAGIALTKITWNSWSDNAATGTGTLTWNTCLPKTCAAGIVQRYKVGITLGGLASGPNANVFSQVALTFPKGGPAGLETGSYTIDNPIH